MSPDLTYYDSILANSSALTCFIIFGFFIFSLSLFSFSFIKNLFNFLLNKIFNHFKGADRTLDISLSVNEIYLIQKSLCFRAKLMDDYSSHKSYELIDKLSQDLVDAKVPVDLKKIGFRDFDDDI